MEEQAKLPKPELNLPFPEKEIPEHSSSPKFKIKPLNLFLGFVMLSFLIAFLVGGFVLGQNQSKIDVSPSPTCTPRPACFDAVPACKMPEDVNMCPPSITPSQTENTDRKIFCTQEAKQCPDGSYVGRTGPNCEFTEC